MYMYTSASEATLRIFLHPCLHRSTLQLGNVYCRSSELLPLEVDSFPEKLKAANKNLTHKVPITTGRRHFESMLFVFFRGNNA